MIDNSLKCLLAFILIIFVAFNSLYMVKQYEQGIVVQFGEFIKLTKAPGLHLKIPFVQNVLYFDQRVLSVTDEDKELIAKDQKRIIVSAYAKYRISDPLKFYQTVTNQAGLQPRLTNILSSSLRQVIGDEPLAALLSGRRSSIVQEIQKLLNVGAKKFGVDVIDVRILRADLPVENSAAIYKRMQADRDKEAKEFRAQGEEEAQIIMSKSDKDKTILLAEANKKAAIIKGQGDAEAIQIYANAFKIDPEFYGFYRSLDAYKKSFKGDDTSMYLSSGDGFLQLFNKMEK